MGRRTGLFNELPVLYRVYVRLLNQFGILTSTVRKGILRRLLPPSTMHE
jgi:hypothetical protein